MLLTVPKSRGSNRDRPEAEAYIPIPAEFRNKYPYWFDDSVDIRKYDQYKTITGKSSIELELHLPNGKVYPARLAQENFKSLQTNPQSALGKWLLYDVLHLEKKEIVTRTILNKAGFDSVRIWHEDPDNKRSYG
ncbi:hypothetical protein KIMC2_20610 [Xylocopilactobacillus apis]|uniref:Uncharacterized protein n=1 Tax=Xylocopilactobacillus apis TaxID=2932183 RepID=A0AAU9DP03_9LACO|nr:hypothetical protein KIMC2_20610 [Xylocopilactobacillus apis]